MMHNLIWGSVGLIIMAVTLVNLKGLLYLKKHGITALGEVIEVREIVRGKTKQVTGYIHRLRYEVDGKNVEADDRTGYNQPFKVGSKQLIVYDPKKPEKFEYEEALKKNINLFAVMLAVTVGFTAYWLICGAQSL
ncbi:MAG: hypothetical protein K5884_08230 [Ruminococcus sp.]|nr:hypothetical protein [Ruminococcus sp.]